MKRFLIRFLAFALAIGMSVGAACDKQTVAVAVTSVGVEQDSLLLMTEEIFTLETAVFPLDATDKKVNYFSSDPAVAAVDEFGTITASAKGTAVITVVSASNPDAKDTVNVEVRLASETIETATFTPPTKLEYKLNETPDYSGGKIEFVLKSGGSQKRKLTDTDVVKSGLDTSTPGKKTVTVTFLNGVWTFDVTVEAVKPFTKDSLADKDYLQKAQNKKNIAQQAELKVIAEGEHKGVSVPVSKAGKYVEFDVFTEVKDVYGLRMKVHSESDGVVFEVGLTKNLNAQGNPYQECTYASSWRGQYYSDPQPLHAQGDNKSSATGGTFEAYAPLKAGYFGTDAVRVAEGLSEGKTYTLRLMALSASENIEADVIFEEIEFIAKADYPASDETDHDKPSVAWNSALLTDAEYVQKNVWSSDPGENRTSHKIVTDGLEISYGGYGLVIAAFPDINAIGGNVYGIMVKVKAAAGTKFDLFLATRSGDRVQTSAEAGWNGREHLTVPSDKDNTEYTIWVAIPDTSSGFSDTGKDVMAYINRNNAVNFTVKATNGSGTFLLTGLEFVTQDEFNAKQLNR